MIIPTAISSLFFSLFPVHGLDCGQATYYHDWYHGRQTASGVLYDRNKVSAASWHYPLGTKLRVTNKDTRKSLVVEVNDKGGYHLLDLSVKASKQLGAGEPDNHSVCVEILP
ncbi:MAG: hypothetical protein IM613_12140 [Cytophagales bacterium]|jgi:rare lipoprotein A|nr:hypothetical protein [Cytophagales bacterium]